MVYIVEDNKELPKQLVIDCLELVLNEMREQVEYKFQKYGLCSWIKTYLRQLIEPQEQANFLYVDIINIINTACNIEIKPSKHYWFDGNMFNCLFITWYKPRIEVVEKTLSYLKNIS